MRKSRVIYGLLLGLISTPAWACTIVTGTDSSGIQWAGNNEDLYFDFRSGLVIHPASEDRFGAASFTYVPGGGIQGGFNERGLFFDFNAVPYGITGERVDLGQRATFAGNQRDATLHILQKFSTVPEALDFLKTYEIPGLDFAQIHLSDLDGRRAVINESGISLPEGDYLASTNFDVVDPDPAQEGSCWRYAAVNDVMQQGVSEQSVRDAMIAAAMDTRLANELTSTIYTNVINVTTGDATNYFAADFSHSYEFNLQEMLEGGEQFHRWVDLIPENPLSQIWKAYEADGIDAALEVYDDKFEGTLALEARQEILRHLFSGLLFAEYKYADAKVAHERWEAIADEDDQSRRLLHGIVLLTNGDIEGARAKFAEQIEFEGAYNLDSEERDAGALAPITKHWVSRLEGPRDPDANVRLFLEGYTDARFVAVDRTDFLPIGNFLTRTEDGWEGWFTMGPGSHPYLFIVDGEEVFDPSNPDRAEFAGRAGTRDYNVVTVEDQ